MIFILSRSKIRQRLDPKKTDYFISWIIQSDLLIYIRWENANLKLDNGQTISISCQMLEASHSKIVLKLGLNRYLIEQFI